MKITGKVNEAIVFTDHMEDSAYAQICTLLNSEASEDGIIRIMPDVHAGASACIGFTHKDFKYVNVNLVGVDQGCGVCGVNLGKNPIEFPTLDKIVRENIPTGHTMQSKVNLDNVKRVYDSLHFDDSWESFLDDLDELSNRTMRHPGHAIPSIGTLGGGNHFISIDEQDNGDKWLIVHSGSRGLGFGVASYWDKKSEKSVKELREENWRNTIAYLKLSYSGQDLGDAISDHFKQRLPAPNKGMCFLSDPEDITGYLEDLDIAQKYAQLNRRCILNTIVEKMGFTIYDTVESIHNYIDIPNRIIRKGAISAKKGERLLIPLNMRDGVILGEGLGNDDWNQSAPHGSGRVMSRSYAKRVVTVPSFQKAMKDVWTSCVGESTVDESPFAYKDPKQMENAIDKTFKVTSFMKEIYNFKAT